MKRYVWLAFGCFFLCSGMAMGFDVSPTQTNVKPSTGLVTVAPEIIDAVLSDVALTEGINLMGLSHNGKKVSSMQGKLSEPLSGTAEEAARGFIYEHASLFNLPAVKDANIVKMVKSTKEAGAEHVSFRMVIDGVPVRDSLIEIHIGKNRTVDLANGSFPTVESIDNQIVLSQSDAIEAAKKALGATKLRNSPQAALEVQAEGNRGTMVYCVKVPAAEPLGDWEIVLNAENGKEISRVNQMVFANGKGTVYPFNPLVGGTSKEDLLHLTAHNLKGDFANVVNEDGPAAISETDEHHYDPADTHFDEVNMYYYITKVHDYFKAMGHNKMDKSLKATVHYGTKYDNAYYSPWEDAMAFGDGNRLNDLSKEESVCWHEYSHATLQTIVSLNYSAESGAINEGQADYFACSLSNDPKLGEWAVQKMGKPYLRHMENSLHYPEDIEGEVHADGEIWGATIWDLRKALGAAVSDILIHKSFFYLKAGSPKFIDGYNAILTADKNLNSGKNAEKITEVFKARGITKAAYDGEVIDKVDIKKFQKFRSVHGE